LNDDEILAALRRLASEREQEPYADPRYEKLALGLASPEERAELEAEALRSPQHADVFRAFQPISPSTLESSIEGAMRAFHESKSDVGDNVRAIRSPRRWIWPLATATAAAVVVGLLTFPKRAAELPPYRVELSGGFAVERSSSAVFVEFTTSSTVTIVLRPLDATHTPVTVDAWIVGDAPRLMEPKLERSSGGTIRITTRAGSLVQEQVGEYQLVFFVRPESEGRRQLAEIQDSHRVLRTRIVVVETNQR
jgi:hypothetical protein